MIAPTLVDTTVFTLMIMIHAINAVMNTLLNLRITTIPHKSSIVLIKCKVVEASIYGVNDASCLIYAPDVWVKQPAPDDVK